MTVAHLKNCTVKELAALAKRKGVPGWHGMRKDELVQALARLAKSSSNTAKRNGSNGHCHANGAKRSKSTATNGKTPGNGRVAATKKSRARVERRITQIKAKLAQSKDLSLASSREENGAEARDRLIVMVRDSHWLHAYWEITRACIDRARASMGQHWYGARPVLRLLEVTRDGTTNSARRVVRDIEIHGGVNNWYVDVDSPPRSFQMEIGYLALDGKFTSLAKSNVVSTPPAGSVKAFDGNWAGATEELDRIYALSGGYNGDGDQAEMKDLFEERLQRPLGPSMLNRFALPSMTNGHANGKREFSFEVDAELVIYGVTEPGANVTLRGEPIRLQPDGTFRMRFDLPDRRQVLPVVANSGDGVEQRTIVLAVERNTKVMEPVIREPEA